MRRTLTGTLVLATLLAMCACAPATRFNWGNYEDALYRYYKSPAERDAYRTALIDAIDRGRAQNSIAPGLLAELGYLYLEDGDQARARVLFEEEITRFPEARLFLARIIDNSATRPMAGGSP